MKQLLTFALIIITFNCLSQEILIIKKDSKRIATKVSGVGSSSIGTRAGTFYYNEMDSVFLKEKKDEDKNLHKRLADAKVKLVFRNFELPTEPVKPVPSKEEQFKNEVLVTSSDIETRLEKFRVQRTTGKALELIAFAAGATASILATDKKPDYDTVKSVWVGAAAIGTIGFIIDLEAGFRLKKH